MILVQFRHTNNDNVERYSILCIDKLNMNGGI